MSQRGIFSWVDDLAHAIGNGIWRVAKRYPLQTFIGIGVLVLFLVITGKCSNTN